MEFIKVHRTVTRNALLSHDGFPERSEAANKRTESAPWRFCDDDDDDDDDKH
jgi:hypothetical protein